MSSHVLRSKRTVVSDIILYEFFDCTKIGVCTRNVFLGGNRNNARYLRESSWAGKSLNLEQISHQCRSVSIIEGPGTRLIESKHCGFR